MWWPFKSARARADNARLNVEHTKRTFQACNLLLTKMDHQLKDIETRLPKDADGSALKGLETTTILTKRHAERTLIHLRKVERHVETMDNHLKRK